MVIEKAGNEGADDKVVTLESLVNRWGLVQASGDRFIIPDVESPGIEITIPTDNVEWVVVEDVAGEAVTHLDAHLELAALCSCAERSVKRKKYDFHLLETKTAGRDR